MADIFLSYARPDRDRVRGLVPILEAQGWSVFWDAAIEPGRRWDKMIADELENARCVVVVWTQSSVLSDWVKDEANRGREREVLVPVSIDGTRAPLGFRHVQIESINEWSSPESEPALQRFLGGVRRIVGDGARQGTAPEPPPAPPATALAAPPEEFQFEAGPDGSFVFDYVTECGDSFASAYAMAYLIATQPVAAGRTQVVPPGRLLVVGANNPHPRQSLRQYEQHLVTPYARAYGAQAKTRRALFAVPGYHRSGEAIGHFEALFCGARNRAARGAGLSFGGWDTHQHHTYFAVPLPHKWWIWGVDIRYGQLLGADQFNYFAQAAEQMTGADRIIICGPQENWLLSDFDDWAEQGHLQKILALAESAGAKVAALITGGRREYAHATIADKAVEVFEVGGGRSFVYPTHLEAKRAAVSWQAAAADPGQGVSGAEPSERVTPMQRDRRRFEEDHHFWYLNKRDAGSLAEDARLGVAQLIYAADNPPPAAEIGAPAPKSRPYASARLKGQYPSRSRSVASLFRNLLFPFSNARYAIVWGLIYWLITWEFQTLVTRHDISSGKIDALGLTTSLEDVLPFMPLYLVQAMLASVSLVFMLGLLYAGLVSYVSVPDWSGWLRVPAKLLIGTTHFLSHAIAMFTISLLTIMLSNWMAPVVERELSSLYRQDTQQSPLVREVIEEGLRPLERQGRQVEPPRAVAAPPRPSPVRELVGFTTYPTVTVVLGSLVSGVVWGVYLALTGLLGRRFAENAFGMLRLKGYRSFLRLRIDPDRLTIYPMGLRRIPALGGWRKSSEYGATTELLPRRPLSADLLERPIVLERARAKAGA